MITMSAEYAAHFDYCFIDGKEHANIAKMTGDRMKMLMLTLPFVVRDLISPEVRLGAAFDPWPVAKAGSGGHRAALIAACKWGKRGCCLVRGPVSRVLWGPAESRRRGKEVQGLF